MAANPTKILLYDLDPELGKLMDSLKRFQGSYTSIYDRLMDLGSDTFTDELQQVIDDLVSGYQNGSVLTIQRIENLKKALEEADELIKKDIEAVELSIEEAIKLIGLVGISESEKYETYDYDSSGNVTVETAYTNATKAKKIYEVTYTYNNPTDAVLQSSQKKVYDADGATLIQTVNKVYEYNAAGDINGIKTTVA